MEKMMKINQSIKRFFQNITSKILVNHKYNKYRNKIKKNQQLSYKLHYQIGVQYYKEYTEQVKGSYKEYCEEILRLNIETKDMQEQMNELKNIITCPLCNHKNDGSVFFCQKCGFLLEKNSHPEDTEEIAEEMTEDAKDIGPVEMIETIETIEPVEMMENAETIEVMENVENAEVIENIETVEIIKDDEDMVAIS